MTEESPSAFLKLLIPRLRQGSLSFLFLLGLVLSVPMAHSQSRGTSKPYPASNDDIFLYRGMGSSYVCNAAQAGIEFSKAVGIAAATYSQVLNGRHGGIVASAGKKKLTNKQLFSGAEFQIVTGALQYCPKKVPADVKEKVQAAIDKQKDKNKN